METDDLTNLSFRDRQQNDSGLWLRRWASFLLAYPAFELLLGGIVGFFSKGFPPASTVLWYVIPSLGLVVSIFFVWQKQSTRPLLALIPAAFYLLMATLAGKLLQLPPMSVVAACVCFVLLSRKVSRA